MGYPTKVQVIKRKDSEQWYINFPAVLAQAMEFEKGETIEWIIKDRYTLTLERIEASKKKAYRQKCRLTNLSTCGRDQIKQLRQEMDHRHHARDRKLVVSGDGSYTNKTVLRDLPDRTVFIGRIRKDAKLHHLSRPDQQCHLGAKRCYGDIAPRPEELRKDESVPWQSVTAHASGQEHTFRVKVMGPLLWRKAGADLPVRLMVVAPVGYRLRKGGKLLYRQPAYLLCTDLEIPVQELLQYYLWRWDIEVNHRDEKQLISVGQAQVWSAQSVERQPAFAVASYAYLLLAALRVYGINEQGPVIPVPKWQAKTVPPRVSAQKLIQLLRSEIWANAIGRMDRYSTDFVNAAGPTTKSQELQIPLESAVIFARTG